MERLAFLTDRSPWDALPAAQALGVEVKAEPLSADSLADLSNLAPAAVVVDAEENPEHAFRLLRSLIATRIGAPVIVLVARSDVERFPWGEVADEMVHSATPPGELRVRLAMLARRTGGTGDSVLRLGPLSLDTETYRVAVAGAVPDLTYKEFELLKFLVQRPGKVFTRGELLQQVWGYNFYGGTRTVDVHVRRLRAKLGPGHEELIQTVRGVGYAAAAPGLEEDATES